MIADADPLISELMQFNLESCGFSVTTYHDVKSAYNADLSGYAMFIIDAMMDGRQGLRLAQYLKQNQDTSLIPLIFCSSRDNADDVIKGLDFGADDYILKPFAMRELIARIRAILRRTSKKIS